MLNAGVTLREIVCRRLDIREATIVGQAVYTGRDTISQIIQARLHAWGIGFPCPLLGALSATFMPFRARLSSRLVRADVARTSDIRANRVAADCS